MQIFALFMLCGIFTTLLIPETKRKTLEELAGEDVSPVSSAPAISHSQYAEKGADGESNGSDKA
jgi:PHS family inorganic phosphate transporter-like MFS transporter